MTDEPAFPLLSPEIQALREHPERRAVSVIITTYNEAHNIAACLRSVAWADEILLVDSFSEDATVEIAGAFPITILQREYYGSAAQKNWAMDKVRHEWVLILDADERVPESLAREILQILTREPEAHGFYIRRQNIFIDRTIRHSGWSTDKVVRLFDRRHGRYPNRRVHADLEIAGAVPVLREPMVHYTFRSFDQYLEKFLNYAEWGAAQGFREGRPAGFVEVGLRPLWRFIRTYILQLGFLDGMHGLVVCGLQAYGTFLKYATLWEHNLRRKLGEEVELPAFDDSDATWKLPDEG